MQSLLDLPNPNYELTSLQLLYDTMENNIWGLESLRRTYNSYGDLLAPIVLVIFHKRVRVFYQGFQTCENNGIHEAVYEAIFIVLENL